MTSNLLDLFSVEDIQVLAASAKLSAGKYSERLKELCDGEIFCLFADLTSLGKLNLIKKLRERGFECDERVMTVAAHKGNMEILEYGHINRLPVSKYASAQAAMKNRYNIIIWLSDRNYPLDETTCAFAASEGHLHLLKKLREDGFPWDRMTPFMALTYGHLETFNWAMANGCPI